MKTYAMNERYAWKMLEEKALVLDTHTGDYFVLNGSGSVIFRGLMNKKGSAEITEDLCRNFMVSEEEASTDVNAFIEKMSGDGILTLQE